MSQTAREQLDAMSKVERDRLYKELLAEAAARIGIRRWRHQRHGIPPGAVEAQDVVSSVLLAAIRSRNPITDLYACLRAEIAKRVDALRKRVENYDRRLEEFTDAGIEFADPMTKTKIGELHPTEQQIFQREISDYLNSDPKSTARQVFALTMEGFPPRFTAEALDLDVRDVYEERKKAKNKLKSIIVTGVRGLKR
jgi:hypothetical protein